MSATPSVQKRIAELRIGLQFCGRQRRPVIQAMIDELMAAANQIPERAAVADPAPKPPEAAGAVDGGDDAGETKARPSAPADARPVGPVCTGDTGKPGRAGEAGGSPVHDGDAEGAEPVHQTATRLPRDQALTAGGDRPASVAPRPPRLRGEPKAPKADAKRAAEEDAIALFLREKGARLVMGPEQVAAFLRDSGHVAMIQEARAPARRGASSLERVWHRQAVLDGHEVPLARLYEVANVLRGKAGLKPVALPAPEAA